MTARVPSRIRRTKAERERQRQREELRKRIERIEMAIRLLTVEARTLTRQYCGGEHE